MQGNDWLIVLGIAGLFGFLLLGRRQTSSAISPGYCWQPRKKTLGTYENIEEIELLDIDPDLLMPRKIRIHRHAEIM